MVEWSITTVLKTVVLRGTGGSNPSLSATESYKSKDFQDFFRLSSYLVWVGVKFSNAKEEELLVNDTSQIGSKKFDFSIE